MFGLSAVGIVIFIKDKTPGFIWMLRGASALLWVGFVISLIIIIIYIGLSPYFSAYSIASAAGATIPQEYITLIYGPVIVFFFWLAIAITYQIGISNWLTAIDGLYSLVGPAILLVSG